MDALVANVAHEQAGDDRAVGLVGHHPLLAVLDGETLQPPVVGPVEMETVAFTDRPAVDHRIT